jgi:uncharacterized cupin superfamily protein
MKTELSRLEELPKSTGLPASIAEPVRPELFVGKHEAQLGKAVGVTQFGVNHITLAPGAASSLRHWHEGEDEFVYILDGEVVLIDDNGEHYLSEGCFVGFPAGSPNAHHLANRSSAPARFIVVGTRKVGLETIHYPDDFAEPRVVTRDKHGNRIEP